MTLAEDIATEQDAWRFLEVVRWQDEPRCAHCGSSNVFLRQLRNPKTRHGLPTQRRLWQCRACKRDFTVLVGTLFHATKCPIGVLLFIFDEAARVSPTPTVSDLRVRYGVGTTTAHRLVLAAKFARSSVGPGVEPMLAWCLNRRSVWADNPPPPAPPRRQTRWQDRARNAANILKGIRMDEQIAPRLTDEERRWLQALGERLHEIYEDTR